MPTNPETFPALFVWVSFEAPDGPPQRVQVWVCPRCRALAADLQAHMEWHHLTGAATPR